MYTYVPVNYISVIELSVLHGQINATVKWTSVKISFPMSINGIDMYTYRMSLSLVLTKVNICIITIQYGSVCCVDDTCYRCWQHWSYMSIRGLFGIQDRRSGDNAPYHRGCEKVAHWLKQLCVCFVSLKSGDDSNHDGVCSIYILQTLNVL